MSDESPTPEAVDAAEPATVDAAAAAAVDAVEPATVDAAAAAAVDAVEPATLDAAVESTRRRAPLWERITLVVGPVLVVVIVLSIMIRFPKVIFSPGSATPVQHAVRVQGAPTFPVQGSIYFLTVRVSSDRPNIWRLAAAWLDDDQEVIDEKDFLGGQSRKQSDQLDVVSMDLSQETAKAVALQKLGYTVPVVGAEVALVDLKGPAKNALVPGDVITAVDGTPVKSPQDVGTAVRARAPGDTVVVAVTRGGTPRDVTITTADDGKGKARIGILTAPKYQFPVDISIDTGSVSGPSAGLAFTLTILDEMTTGALTGGKKVAVTGTIDGDGTVGAVGGVAQKATAAAEAGATLMLVPADEVRDAERHAGRMKVVGVRTLDEALAALVANGGEPLPARPQAA